MNVENAKFKPSDVAGRKIFLRFPSGSHLPGLLEIRQIDHVFSCYVLGLVIEHGHPRIEQFRLSDRWFENLVQLPSGDFELRLESDVGDPGTLAGDLRM